MKKLTRAFLAGTAILFSTHCAPTIAATTVTMPGGFLLGSTLVATVNSTILPSSVFYSPNQRYFLTFQNDGNLVVYRVGSPNVAIFDTGTANAPGATALFQGDGNLVIYRNINDLSSYIWASNTGGSPNDWNVAQMRLWDDGRLTIEGVSGLFYETWPDPKTWSASRTDFIIPGCNNPGNRIWGTFQQYVSGSNAYFKSLQLNKPQGSCALN